MASAENPFGGLKRRTTDLMNNMPNIPKPSMPAMPNMPNMPTEMPQLPQLPQFPSLADLSSRLPKMPAWGPAAATTKPTVKATWERIDVPPLSRSSHSINIVSGNAYIFGGEIEPRKPVDNDMHVIVLPYSSASADYYAVKPKAAPKPDVPQIPTVVEPIAEDEVAESEEKAKEKDLSDVDLASPAQEGGESAVAAPEDTADRPAPSAASKGKAPAHADGDTSALGSVPGPRVGHATAVIGTRIFLFGGRGGPDLQPLEEYGRVWVFDTKTHLWTYLDPYLPAAEPLSPAFADKRRHYPAARSYHTAAGVDQPRDFPAPAPAPRRAGGAGGAGPGGPPGPNKLKRTATWTEWAQGDSNVVGTPQQPIVGNIASSSRDEDDDGYGTFIVHGGCFAEGRAADTWAFDVRSHVWQELPAAPGKPRGGAGLAVAGGRLWRFGGFNGEGEEGGQLDYLELGVDDFNDRSAGPGDGDIFLSARGEWKSIWPGDLPTDASAATAAAKADSIDAAGGDAAAAQPLTDVAVQGPYWPGHRSVAGMQSVTIGGAGGREYLVVALGERDPSSDGHAAAGKFWDDAWAYELPRPTAASSVMGAMFGARSRSASHAAALAHGKWFRIETEAYDDDDPYASAGPGPRGWFASAHMGELEERGVVIWGGINGDNKRLGDGWILRMGDEKREP